MRRMKVSVWHLLSLKIVLILIGFNEEPLIHVLSHVSIGTIYAIFPAFKFKSGRSPEPSSKDAPSHRQ